ncbi:hypothetical protein SCE1572_21895 [Sorangium cellulosum So0157-2]|uniref:Uncharacterized protein n=1 Tax=Sorangium cellulosum So0157-2 TaxID=1254432 RepID=S4XUN6_SORCE|nr:hypothetical protein SCE1572_21895 [Sorangium cellulosum So0157-2]
MGERALGAAEGGVAVGRGRERRRDAVEPALRPGRVAGGEVEIAQVEQREPRRVALLRRRGGALERVARAVPADALPRAPEAEPHVGAPGHALREVGERGDDLLIEPRVLRGVGPERESDGRVGQDGEDGAGVLAGLERHPLRERGLGGAALVFEAEREDLDPPEESVQRLDEPRHGRDESLAGGRSSKKKRRRGAAVARRGIEPEEGCPVSRRERGALWTTPQRSCSGDGGAARWPRPGAPRPMHGDDGRASRDKRYADPTRLGYYEGAAERTAELGSDRHAR